MALYFTSDTHFGHANILKYTDRGKLWDSVEQMDEALIHRWNRVVQPPDEVFHLGDVSWHKEPLGLLNQLNGRIRLVRGNHDHKKLLQCGRFESIDSLMELKLSGRLIVLCHYKLEVWNKSHHGSTHLYGHSHGTLPGDNQCCDVGVDNFYTDYSPISLEVVDNYLSGCKTRKPVDHHKGETNA